MLDRRVRYDRLDPRIFLGALRNPAWLQQRIVRVNIDLQVHQRLDCDALRMLGILSQSVALVQQSVAIEPGYREMLRIPKVHVRVDDRKIRHGCVLLDELRVQSLELRVLGTEEPENQRAANRRRQSEI